jgi:perosamine synthetase
MNERRREIAAHYDKGLQALDWIERLVEREYTRSARHNYVIQTEYRDELNLFLKERGIATGVHYLPIHLQPFYRNAQNQSLPAAERTWRRLLTLPLYPDLSDEEVEYILDAVRAFGEQHVRTAVAAGQERDSGV